MKTTVELPDELLVAVKKRAAETRSTMKEILERGLRLELASTGGPRKPRRIHWVTVPGRLDPGLDVSSREAMHDFLRRNDRD
jgi:hypothetical protein